MTAILERRESESLWGRFCNWITSTENRLYIGWFGVVKKEKYIFCRSISKKADKLDGYVKEILRFPSL